MNLQENMYKLWVFTMTTLQQETTIESNYRITNGAIGLDITS